MTRKKSKVKHRLVKNDMRKSSNILVNSQNKVSKMNKDVKEIMRRQWSYKPYRQLSLEKSKDTLPATQNLWVFLTLI